MSRPSNSDSSTDSFPIHMESSIGEDVALYRGRWEHCCKHEQTGDALTLEELQKAITDSCEVTTSHHPESEDHVYRRSYCVGKNWPIEYKNDHVVVDTTSKPHRVRTAYSTAGANKAYSIKHEKDPSVVSIYTRNEGKKGNGDSA